MANGASVFISYAADTKRWAEELTKELERQGIESWVDFKDLHPGQQVKAELERAVDKAVWFLVLVGLQSRTTPGLEAQWQAILARTWESPEKRLLPIVFGDGAPPPFLRNWVPLRINSDADTSTWTRRVLDVLRNGVTAIVHVEGRGRIEFKQRMEELGHAANAFREDQPNSHAGG